MRTVLVALAAALIALPVALSPVVSPIEPAVADEKPVQLKKAPELEAVETNCASCHSLDYIEINSPFPSPALWDAEVTKMIKTFGAPIAEADAKIIADYLKKNYGN